MLSNEKRKELLQGDNSIDFLKELELAFTQLEEAEQKAREAHMLRLYQSKDFRDYRKLRALYEDLQERMLQMYFSQPEKVLAHFQENLDKLPAQNHRTKPLEFYPETDADHAWLADMIIFPRNQYNCMCNYFLKHRHVRSKRNTDFLHAMMNAPLGLYEITAIDSQTGIVTYQDCFDNQSYQVYDEDFSLNQDALHKQLLTRIITFEDISFATHHQLVFQKGNLRNWLKKRRNRRFSLVLAQELFQKYKELFESVRL